MSARIVSFVSAKGGSGKTVTSSALGTFLAALGFKTLLIDTDAATNGMTLLYLEQLLGSRQREALAADGQRGLFEVSPKELPTEIEVGENLFFVPATFRMTETEDGDYKRFSESLDSTIAAKRGYDFILLDAQAGTDGYAKIAARAAEIDVIVSEYDPISAQGIERLKIFFSAEMSPSSTWTLFNKVLPEFASVIGEGLSVARFLPPVPWDADVVRAFARRDLALNMAMPNPYTLAIAQLAYRIFPEECGNAIEEWRGGAFKSAVSPVEQRLEELKLVEGELRYFERLRDRRVSILSAVMGCVTIAAAMSAFNIFPIWREPFETQLPRIIAAVGIAAAAAIMFVTLLGPQEILKRFRSLLGIPKDTTTLASVVEEREKLLTSLEAARSVFRVEERAGIYEVRRRKSPPQSS